jgi:cell division protein FtsX
MTDDSEWIRWPVAWTAIWVGALSALAVGLIIGLVGFALGAHEVSRYVDWKKVHLITLVFDVAGAFFAYVAGGWVAGRIAGIRRSEPAMLHGAIVWLLTIPFLLVLASLGGLTHFGGWYGGLAGTPAWSAVASTDPYLAEATRNNALATAVALLLGLVGSVIGGWMASGEPMTFTHYRTRGRIADATLTERRL